MCFGFVFGTQTFLYKLFKVDTVDKLTKLPSTSGYFWVIVFHLYRSSFILLYTASHHKLYWALKMIDWCSSSIVYTDGVHSIVWPWREWSLLTFRAGISGRPELTILTEVISTWRLVATPPLHPTQTHHQYRSLSRVAHFRHSIMKIIIKRVTNLKRKWAR